jgi:hypothetical protein
MSVPAKVDLEAYRGDTWSQKFRFLQEGVPEDLTGADVVSWARETTGEIHELAVTVGPDPGVVTIAFPSAPAPLPPRDVYQYDIEVTYADGRVRTWVYGRLHVLHDVSNVTLVAVR